jgi:hypothetical protein
MWLVRAYGPGEELSLNHKGTWPAMMPRSALPGQGADMLKETEWFSVKMGCESSKLFRQRV